MGVAVCWPLVVVVVVVVVAVVVAVDVAAEAAVVVHARKEGTVQTERDTVSSEKDQTNSDPVSAICLPHPSLPPFPILTRLHSLSHSLPLSHK